MFIKKIYIINDLDNRILLFCLLNYDMWEKISIMKKISSVLSQMGILMIISAVTINASSLDDMVDYETDKLIQQETVSENSEYTKLEADDNLLETEGTITIGSGVGKVSKNTSSTSNKYSGAWQYWSQGASKYRGMRSSGCRVTAFAKLLREAGYGIGNPDDFLIWGVNKGFFKSTSNVTEMGTFGGAILRYVSDNGGSSSLIATNTLTGNTNTDKANIMNYIRQGYYVVLSCSAHIAYIGREASLNNGTPVILDSWSSWSTNPASVHTYTGKYDSMSGVTFDKYRVYSVTNQPAIGGVNVSLWGVNENDTFSGTVQLWAKRFDEDNNHYAVFYIDDQLQTGHLTADSSGYFSFWMDTRKLTNGQHRLRVDYVNSISLVKDEKVINIYNEMESPRILLWGMDENNTFSGTVQLWAKRFDEDNNHYAVFYIDDQAQTAHLSADTSGYFSFWLNTENLENGQHRLKVEYVNSTSLVQDETVINVLNESQSIEKRITQSIDFPADNSIYKRNDMLLINGWINPVDKQSFKARFYIDSIMIKEFNYLDLFYRDDIEFEGGYSFSYNISELEEGIHTLTLKSEDGYGAICSERKFIISGENYSSEKTENNNGLSNGELIESFVKRMYTVVLSREAENSGLIDWSSRLSKQEIDGAGIANGFINSTEFKHKNLNDNDYLDVLYRTFFNREADAGGKAYWLNHLTNGTSRTEVLSGFVNSQEFSEICDQYGIARGTMQTDGTSIYKPGVRNYVLRMYTKALNRNGETVGVEDWTNRINTKIMSPEIVAKSFFNSQEFINRNLNNADYVETLYQTFMDRASDASGKQYWIDQLNNGMSRQQVLEGFSRSVEFSEIMRKYGL